MKSTVKKSSAKTVGEDSRLNKSRGESRKDRAREERVVLSDRELTDDERLDAFRMNLFNAQLPDIPAIPDYHVMWLTTTNRQDPLHGRLRMGYELIKADDLPGWESVSVKTGDYNGFIMVNEMIAAKIPMRLYQEFMKEVHHTQPLGEDAKLRAMTEQAQEDLARRGLKPAIGNGTMELGAKDPGAPDFGRLHGETHRPYRPFELEKKIAAASGSDEEEDEED